MNIFVSWSGEFSQKVASILHKYLPCMLQDLEVFVSKHDIESGVRWASRLAEELEKSDFGILCLTDENLSSDWLLFEAGALSKKIEGRACGLLLGDLRPTSITGPLAQFQHRSFTKDDFSTLVSDLNAVLAKPLEQEQLDMVLDKWWPDISDEYARLADAQPPAEGTEVDRDESDILEEILGLSRTIASAVVSRPSEEATRARLLKRKISALESGQLTLLARLHHLKDIGDFDAAQTLAEERREEVDHICAAGLARWDDEGRIKIRKGLSSFLPDPSNDDS